MKRKVDDTTPTRNTDDSELTNIGVLPEAPKFCLEPLSEYSAVSPFSGSSSIPEISTLRRAHAAFMPEEKRSRRTHVFGRLFRQRVAVKPWLAPPLPSGATPTSLEEKNRKFGSRKIKDLWDVFYQFRGDFPRPDESSSELKRLCFGWKRKHDGKSPRALLRFFKSHPDIAVWAVWVERAIHETPLRSGKNKSPRMDLMRECLRILVDAQMKSRSIDKSLTNGRRNITLR